MCVRGLFFLRASAELFCLAGLLLSPGIYCFHNFPVWMLCIKLWIVETTLQVFWTVRHYTFSYCMITCPPKSYRRYMVQAQNSSNPGRDCSNYHFWLSITFWHSARQASLRKGSIIAACVVGSLQHHCVCISHFVLNSVLLTNGASARCRSALILYLTLSFNLCLIYCSNVFFMPVCFSITSAHVHFKLYPG